MLKLVVTILCCFLRVLIFSADDCCLTSWLLSVDAHGRPKAGWVVKTYHRPSAADGPPVPEEVRLQIVYHSLSFLIISFLRSVLRQCCLIAHVIFFLHRLLTQQIIIHSPIFTSTFIRHFSSVRLHCSSFRFSSFVVQICSRPHERIATGLYAAGLWCQSRRQ